MQEVGVSMAVNVSVSQLHDEHRTYFKLMHGLLAGFISASSSKSYVVCKEWNGKKLAQSEKEAFSWKGRQGSMPHLVQRTGISFSLHHSSCLTCLKCYLQVGLVILLWLLPFSNLGWMSNEWRMWFCGTECEQAALAMSH